MSVGLVASNRGAPECLAKFTLLAYLGKTPSLISRDADYLIRQTLLLLLYTTRPLSISELREALDFSLKYGRSQHKQDLLPEDVADYLNRTFPGVARVQLLPTEVPTVTHDGKHLWSVKQCQHALVADDHISSWIDSLKPTDYLYFDPATRQIEMMDLCLKYISGVPGVIDMTEPDIVEACAEFPFLRYALTSLPVHASFATPSALRDFVHSDTFGNTRILAAASILLPMTVRMNQYELLKTLVYRIDPNAREQGPGSHCALTCAAIAGNMQMVNLLLSLPNINVDLQVHGDMTALHFAIQNECLGIARLLMAKGRASVTIQDSHGWNALRFLFRNTGAKATYHQKDHYFEMTKTIDQIMLNAKKESLDIKSFDLEIARQNGNEPAVDYFVTRYMPELAPRRRSLSRLLPRLKQSLTRQKAVSC